MSKKRKSKFHLRPSSSVVRSSQGPQQGTTADLDRPGVAAWVSSDPTAAPPLAPARSEGWVDSAAGLADKVLHGQRPINLPFLASGVVLAWLAGAIWLYIQDNSAGRLVDWPAIGWFLKKVAALTALVAVAAAALFGIVKYQNRVFRGDK